MKSAAATREEDGHYNRLVAEIVGLWFVMALGFSLFGIFDSRNRPPLSLAMAAILPVAIFAIWYRVSPSFKRFVLAADPGLLAAAQSWRVAGLVFVLLYSERLLPASFALPAGWGDFAIGITAPLVAFLISSHRLRWPLFAVWNALGILDLIIAVTLGVLSSATPVGILAGDVTTEIMGKFPLSLVPTFLVPLFVIFHLIALAQARAATTPDISPIPT
jgi:hypothetical protein